MTVITWCTRCDEEGRIDIHYLLEFNPYDITECGEVKTHLVRIEMFVDSSFGRCRNGHRDPAAFLVGAIHDHLVEIHWYQAGTNWAGRHQPHPTLACALSGGPLHQPAQPCGSTRGGGVLIPLCAPAPPDKEAA